ncbi:AAA family ATPase [Paenibacillus chitinolyticus]
MTKKEKSFNKGITSIQVKGYKSFLNECTIELNQLTILAGSNSSGKSSIFQPVLLMKQTVDELYDPGALQLNGPNVKFSASNQLISKDSDKKSFMVNFGLSNGSNVGIVYKKRGESKAGFEIDNLTIEKKNDIPLKLSTEMESSEVIKIVDKIAGPYNDVFKQEELIPKITRLRCFLGLSVVDKETNSTLLTRPISTLLESSIRRVLHLPGLRGNPERNYPVTAVDFEESHFPGTFEKYVASIIAHWKDTKNYKALRNLKKYLSQLGLANDIDVEYINDTEIAIYVSRSNCSDVTDKVSIADVGLGLSQTLPILVALLIAKDNQIVYIEQPEIHLHPRAQYYLANIFADSIKRGVKVVIETHSSVLLRGIQTLVVERKIPENRVKLHWFLRDQSTGYSYVNSAELDETGSFGDWPEDFDDTAIMAEANYLNAVEMRLMKNE